MEILGSDDPLTDAEIISAAVNLYQILGLKEIKVNLNTLGDNESRNNYREALVKYFKPHIKDFCEDCQERLLFVQKVLLELFVVLLKIKCMEILINRLKFIIMVRCIVMRDLKVVEIEN